MEYLFDYLLFLAQAVTIVVALLLVLSAVVSLGHKRQDHEGGHLEVRKLNDRLLDLRHAVEDSILNDAELKVQRKREIKEEKAEAKLQKKAAGEETTKPRLFVLDFDGDVEAGRTEFLRTEITAVLTLAKPQDEVLLRLTALAAWCRTTGLRHPNFIVSANKASLWWLQSTRWQPVGAI